MANFHLRVNGIQPTQLRVRPKMVDGYPSCQQELVVTDPEIGSFAVNDEDFILELRDLEPAASERVWVKVSCSTILSQVLSGERDVVL